MCCSGDGRGANIGVCRAGAKRLPWQQTSKAEVWGCWVKAANSKAECMWKLPSLSSLLLLLLWSVCFLEWTLESTCKSADGTPPSGQSRGDGKVKVGDSASPVSFSWPAAADGIIYFIFPSLPFRCFHRKTFCPRRAKSVNSPGLAAMVGVTCVGGRDLGDVAFRMKMFWTCPERIRMSSLEVSWGQPARLHDWGKKKCFTGTVT